MQVINFNLSFFLLFSLWVRNESNNLCAKQEWFKSWGGKLDHKVGRSQQETKVPSSNPVLDFEEDEETRIWLVSLDK